MAKYLDNNGLLYVLNKIKAAFAVKGDSIKNITRSGTTFTATKADGTTFTFTQQDNTVAKTTTTPLMNGTAAIGTETKYAAGDHVHPSDESKVDKVDGMGLSSNDYTTIEKNKLAGIASGAEVNQNAFSNVTIGSTTIAADGKTDTLTLVAGSNVTLTPDATNDKITIAATNTTYTPASADPLMDGTAAVGTSAKYAREDHVHPTDTSRVSTSTTVNGHALSGNVTVTKTDVGLGNVDNTADANKTVSKANTLTTARTIDGVSFDGSADIVHYGTCDTAAATTAKVVSCTGFTLATGAMITVKFTVTNTGAVANLTLNVNGTGAKPIKYRNANLSAAGVLAANRFYTFVYDGTNYQLVGDLDTNTTYTNETLGQGYGTCTTAQATAAKVVTLSGYTLVKGGVVAVRFTNGSCVDATLNINSKGAKPIVARGGDPANTYSWYAGELVTFMYDGTNYQLISTDQHLDQWTVMSQAYDGDTPIPNKLVFSPVVEGHISESYQVFTTGARGAANGVCPLDSNSLVPSEYLPSYVDDVIEAYARSGATALSATWLSTTSGGAALTPETGKIYILMADSGDYAANTQFRWSGSAYVKMLDGGVSAITNAEIDTIWDTAFAA